MGEKFLLARREGVMVGRNQWGWGRNNTHAFRREKKEEKCELLRVERRRRRRRRRRRIEVAKGSCKRAL